MSEHVTVENRIRLWGGADAVVDLFDNWEGMNLVSIRIGCADGKDGVVWSCDELALGWDMVRGLAEQLSALADANDARGEAQ